MKTKIVVDYDRCKDPRTCKKCLQICPPAIFILYPPDYVSNDPTEWRVDVAFTDLCTRCRQCVGVCPFNAITIK